MPTDAVLALPPPKLGRPSLFNDHVATTICEGIAAGQRLTDICEPADMPRMMTVFKWLGTNDAFAQNYGRAREIAAERLVDEILSIADDAKNDWMERFGKGAKGWNENGEAIRRSALRIDSRKWLASKLLPKVYGEKQQLDVQATVTLRALILEAVAPKAPQSAPQALLSD